MRVLVVEDDNTVGNTIVSGLMAQGYAVDRVEDVASAETVVKTSHYTLVILDINLPDGSGMDVLRLLRQQGNAVPVLILTGYDDVGCKVDGLDGGADDYLVKPFEFDELLARLRALHRRSEGHSAPILSGCGIELDPAAMKVIKSGKIVNLGPKEFYILQMLMEKGGNVVSKDQLEDSLYGWDEEVESNTVEVHVCGLRKKLGRGVIETVKYMGYRFAL